MDYEGTPTLKGQVLGMLQERLERRSWRGGRWRRLQTREEQFPGLQGAGSERPHNILGIEVPPIASQGCWGPASVLITPRLCRTCPERDKEVFSWLELGVAKAVPSSSV